MKLQEILNKYKDSIYGGWEHITLSGTNIDLLRFERKEVKKGIRKDFANTATITIRHLLSPESGFMQACKWKGLDIDDMYEGDEIEDTLDMSYGRDDRQYHTMRCSILTDEEVVKYLEENVE